MKFCSSSMSILAFALTAGAVSLPARADGVPAPRVAKHAAAHLAQPMTTAARKANDSGIALQYRVDGVAQAGRPVNVFLQFDGVTDATGATVRLTTDAGLVLAGSSTMTLPAGQRTNATVTLTSQKDGLAYLNVFMTQNGVTSVDAIPVQTGSATPAMRPAGEMKSTPEGENIITMPATEGK